MWNPVNCLYYNKIADLKNETGVIQYSLTCLFSFQIADTDIKNGSQIFILFLQARGNFLTQLGTAAFSKHHSNRWKLHICHELFSAVD